MQRGGVGGNFGKLLKAHKEQHEVCKRTCDRIIPDPMKNYTKLNPTPNGWYLDKSRLDDWGGGNKGGIEQVILNNSITIKIGEESHKKYDSYLDMLEELPDPTKTYTTGNLGSKEPWKLIYDTDDELLKWKNQNDHTQVVPFDIDSPLKIGDKMALSDHPARQHLPTTNSSEDDRKNVSKLVEQIMAVEKARRRLGGEQGAA
jgi:hypothetical protein